VALALARSPRVAARAAAITGARHVAPAAGALPDPMVSLSARGEDYPGAGIGDEPMAMAAVELSQTIPWPGKQRRREAAATASVAVAEGDLESARRQLAAEVRAAYAGLVALDQEARATGEAIDLVELLRPAVGARYETGQAEQTDLVSLQLERLRLLSDLDATAAARAELAASLEAALDTIGVAPPRTAGVLPAVGDAVAGASPDSFAAVGRARAEVERARLFAAAARREGRPDLVVGAEYGWRDALPPMVTVRVGVELPLWRGRKQDALAEGAVCDLAMAEAQLRDARAAAAAESATLAARIAAASRQAARLRVEVVPHAELAVAATRASYVAGRGELAGVVDALRTLVGARAELSRREAEHYAAWARLRALAGRDPELNHEEP